MTQNYRERSLRGNDRAAVDLSLLFYIGEGLAAFAAYVVAHRVFVYRPFERKLDEIRRSAKEENDAGIVRLKELEERAMELQRRLDNEVERRRLLYDSWERAA